MLSLVILLQLFFFNATAPTAIYTLSLHDALPIFTSAPAQPEGAGQAPARDTWKDRPMEHDYPEQPGWVRSEEHTSELQSHVNLVCRLLLEKKNTTLFFNTFIMAIILSFTSGIQ